MEDPKLEKIHEDDRGTIYRVLIPPDFELMLFRCKAGYKRGGHSHTAPEVVAVLSGKMRYHKAKPGGHISAEEKRPGDVIRNLPNEPHMGEFLEDTWVAEWKYGPDGGIGRWVTNDYEPLRVQARQAHEG